ncbi:response regulator [Polaribacter vadi]|uniref:response regulator n=1 Tax=Polaribacter TaxID=52959 RepID=UPI001C0A387D|nr:MULTISPECIES: response regulator [Polaribacter]MBU3011956.1 response regulator [Polaribacter vadi]MDO6741771.1 response regulator [Polaribacter sp. 1_MG-2023]
MSEGNIKKTSNRLKLLSFYVSIGTACMTLFTTLIALFFDLNNLAYYSFFTIFLYVYCAYLSRNGKLFFARILILILLNLGITITASYMGRAASIEYMFLYAIAMPFSMFSFRTEKIYVYLFSSLSGVLWILLAITDFKLISNTQLDIDIVNSFIYPISVIGTFLMIILQLIYFSILGARYYSRIDNKKQEALEASQSKSKFLSTMSHEIRTPLNAIIGLSHILGNNNPKKNQIQNIEALNFSGKTLLNLLNNVLDFSKMQSTTIELDTIHTNLYNDLKQIIKIHKPVCTKKGILLNLEIDDNIPDVCLDIVRFNQVINNLISNAIKFTDEGSVTLIIKKVYQNKNNITLNIEVKDTGIGIPKNKQETIWEAFAQASNTTNRIYGGTGLGLPIVKSIVEVMGSKVEIISSEKKGSRFIFDLKLKVSEKIKTNDITKNNIRFFENKKVLLVDDNLINIMVGKQILERSKLKVEVANNGLVAVNKLKQEEFDIILMDIQMPVMDGYTATKEIREFNKSTPIIALSANVFSEIKDKIEDSGMNGFIFKPFTPEELLNQLEEFLSN